MSVTTSDSIEMEEPEWLTRMETVLEVLNEGVTRGIYSMIIIKAS